MSRRTVSRKGFLALGGASGASLLAGCDFSTKPDTRGSGAGEEAPSREHRNGPQAPRLEHQVKAGKLPPVKKRIPAEPRVIKPVDRVGQYGGTWRTVLASKDTTWLFETVYYGSHLVHWDRQWRRVIPHLAKSVDVSDDARHFTFTLRKGTRWSDGQPFTADDIVFWRDAVLADEDLTPAIGPDLGDDGKPFTATKLDDFRVRISFENPHGLFLQYLAAKTPYFVLIPRHYMMKYHKRYNSDIARLVEGSNVGDWTELFLQKMDPFNNVDMPTLAPWVAKNPWSDGQRQTWIRNPYYPCVDHKGSQLPYLDKVTFAFFSDPQPLLLSVAHGDVDMYMRAEITIPKFKPVLARSRRSGRYKLVDVKESDHNTMGICFNLTHKDPIKRKIYQNKDFRIGLSHAINRRQIINAVYQRQGRPAQTAPRPECPFYDAVAKEMAGQFTRYDLSAANKRLDRAGYAERDGHGRRLGPDGKPIAVTVLTQTRYPFMASALEMIKGTWAKVGVQMHINNADSTLVGNLIQANRFDCTVDHGELGYLGLIGDPRWLFATGGSSYAPLWSNWFEGGTPNEEPPVAMKRQMELWHTEVFPKATLDEEYVGIKKIVAIARDQFWTMGVSLPAGSYAIVSDRFHNVPGDDQMWLAFACPYPSVDDPSQFFIEE